MWYPTATEPLTVILLVLVVGGNASQSWVPFQGPTRTVNTLGLMGFNDECELEHTYYQAVEHTYSPDEFLHGPLFYVLNAHCAPNAFIEYVDREGTVREFFSADAIQEVVDRAEACGGPGSACLEVDVATAGPGVTPVGVRRRYFVTTAQPDLSQPGACPSTLGSDPTTHAEVLSNSTANGECVIDFDDEPGTGGTYSAYEYRCDNNGLIFETLYPAVQPEEGCAAAPLVIRQLVHYHGLCVWLAVTEPEAILPHLPSLQVANGTQVWLVQTYECMGDGVPSDGGVAPSPFPTPSSSPSPTPSLTPTATPTSSTTPSFGGTPTATSTPLSASASHSPPASASPTPSPTPSSSPSPSVTPTALPSPSPSSSTSPAPFTASSCFVTGDPHVLAWPGSLFALVDDTIPVTHTYHFGTGAFTYTSFTTGDGSIVHVSGHQCLERNWGATSLSTVVVHVTAANGTVVFEAAVHPTAGPNGGRAMQVVSGGDTLPALSHAFATAAGWWRASSAPWRFFSGSHHALLLTAPSGESVFLLMNALTTDSMMMYSYIRRHTSSPTTGACVEASLPDNCITGCAPGCHCNPAADAAISAMGRHCAAPTTRRRLTTTALANATSSSALCGVDGVMSESAAQAACAGVATDPVAFSVCVSDACLGVPADTAVQGGDTFVSLKNNPGALNLEADSLDGIVAGVPPQPDNNNDTWLSVDVIVAMSCVGFVIVATIVAVFVHKKNTTPAEDPRRTVPSPSPAAAPGEADAKVQSVRDVARAV